MSSNNKRRINIPILIVLIGFLIGILIILAILFEVFAKQSGQGWTEELFEEETSEVIEDTTTIEEEATVVEEQTSNEVETTDTERTELMGDVYDFEYDMLSTTENSNFSPLSLRYAMLALQAGANDEVAQKIGEFNLTTDLDASLEEFQEMMNGIETTEIANGIFIDNGLNNPVIIDSYKEQMQKSLDMEVQDVNFGSGEAQEVINSWVEDKTHGLITEFQVDNSTSAAILNALYYKDKWKYFDEADTDKQIFTTPEGEKEVDMMHSTLKKSSEYILYRWDGYYELELFLENSTLNIILPDEDKTLEEVIEAVRNCEEAPSREKYDSVIVSLPKFKFSTSGSLKELLIQYGLADIFESTPGMFSNMAEQDVYVSDVVQKTTVEVNEEGAEASAVTGVMVKNTALMLDTPTTFEFNVNRPFLFEIWSNDESMGDEELFIGTVVDPTAE